MALLAWLLVSLVITLQIEAARDDGVLTVATYNLWNVMFNWEVRKFRIAQMVSGN